MRYRGIVFVLAILSVAALMPGCGCRKNASTTVANKIAEKAIEHAAKKNGQDLDVKVDASKGSVSYQSKQDGENIKVNVDGGKVTAQGTTADNKPISYTAQDGSFSMTQGGMKMSSGAGATLPEGFPKDVPVYPGVTITMGMANSDEQSYSVTAETKDALQNVADKYKKDLVANGWAEQSSFSQTADSPMAMLSYTKDGRVVVISIQAENGKTTISIAVSKQ